jgi:hypothetical protein
MNQLQNNHWTAIRRQSEGQGERSKPEKGSLWRKQDNAAKHGVGLRVWWEAASHGDNSSQRAGPCR